MSRRARRVRHCPMRFPNCFGPESIVSLQRLRVLRPRPHEALGSDRRERSPTAESVSKTAVVPRCPIREHGRYPAMPRSDSHPGSSARYLGDTNSHPWEDASLEAGHPDSTGSPPRQAVRDAGVLGPRPGRALHQRNPWQTQSSADTPGPVKRRTHAHVRGPPWSPATSMSVVRLDREPAPMRVGGRFGR